jgi:hypothetical protein
MFSPCGLHEPDGAILYYRQGGQGMKLTPH